MASKTYLHLTTQYLQPMNDRILKILEFYKISQIEFARKLTISGSNLSHILSNRHKPSSEFFEKLLLAYPDVNIEWVLIGKGEMMKNQKQLEIFPGKEILSIPLEIKSESINNPPNNPVFSGEKNHSERKFDSGESFEVTKKILEKVIFIYSDHSFEEFNQALLVAK